MAQIKKSENVIKYDVFKTKTGRLITKSDSFPILTLDKKFRSIIIPENDMFVELDYNAADVRVFLGLAGQLNQPQEDIHTWNAINIFNDPHMSRDDVKKKFFHWFYDSSVANKEADLFYNKKKVLEQYYQDGIARSFFDKKMEADSEHALSYVVQSTTSGVCNNAAVRVDEVLKNRKSHISFLMHDAVIIDMANEDFSLIQDIVDVYKRTELGDFVVGVKAGKNYGNMLRM
jgi:DNA polymerase I-like protein with 3'-5' exonuclease and polymerase domains